MNILSTIEKHSMFSPGDLVIVAVSGGPDSVALLHSLHELSSSLSISLHVAHVNHGIRGAESDADEDFVRGFAHSLGLQISVMRADVPSIRESMRLGEEEAARLVRHEFLRETCERLNADKIALGHTADDRAESVLLNVIRGSGVDGLGSIRPVRGKIVRPLIETWRSEIEAYIAENHLCYRTDASNADTTYTRNRVRHELIPLLERDYNPQVKSALVRLAEIAASESEFISHVAEDYSIGDISHAPPALQYRIIRSEIERLKGNLMDVSFEQIDRVVQALRYEGDFTITLPSGEIFASRRGDDFRIYRSEKIEPIAAFDYPIDILGKLSIPEIGATIHAQFVELATPAKLPPTQALIDIGSIKGTLRARSVHPGDRIIPFGMRGSKKLQDVFVDRKISRACRAKAVVIEDDEKILWVAGVIASELTRVTESTTRVLHLSLEIDQ